MSNVTSLIESAVEPLRAAAVERARTRALELATWLLERYLSHPDDFVVPSLTFTNKKQHEIAKANRAALYAISNPKEPNNHKSARVRDEKKIEHFVRQAGEDASAQYTAFVLKLEQKIGACDSAELTGDHVWGHSVLTVRKGAEQESWTTHMIINVSKLGRVFNQWPTRKNKG